MVAVVTHLKTNAIADWTQADLDAQIALGNFPAGTVLADIVLPSDWNDDHVITGLGSLAYASSVTSAEISDSTITAGSTLSGSNTGDQTNITGNAATATTATSAAPYLGTIAAISMYSTY